MSNYTTSEKLFNEACKHIPGGVNSPVRAFKSVGMHPLYITHGRGGHIFDVDGNEYVDFISSWGPHLLGHAHPAIIEAVQEAVLRGTGFGACVPQEIEMAEMIKSFFPSMDMVRMVNSGTEATMSAVRLARGYTERNLIIKFDGCYHGHSDGFLVQAGSGVQTFSSVQNNGVTKRIVSETLIARFNDIDSVRQLFEEHPNEIAAVIVEPVMGNMGVILPKFGFLQQLRDLCTLQGTLLIFDEVITGFRLSKGGAQMYYGITPDLTCLGKIIGGGLPVGAFGGKLEIMQSLSPLGAVYQAGTLSGNPLALAAGCAMLRLLSDDATYEMLNSKAKLFSDRVAAIAAKYPDKLRYNVSGTLSTLFFTGKDVCNADDARQCDCDAYARYFRSMLHKGYYLPPSQFEAIFVSGAHTPEELLQTADAIEATLAEIL